MLARQGWRMLTNPGSLCARVLKARYFLDGSILDTKPINGISYSWRSILKGVQLLKDGLIWRVGDGANINIWNDMWLNRDGTRQPITPRGQCLLTHVNELIDPATGQWDEALVRQTFWDMDVPVILSTPIRPDFEDFPAWYFDNKGVFSIKSAYKIYVKQRDADMDTSSGGSTEESFWKQLWDLPCLPKVKQFMWRLTHNSPPLRKNLSLRGVKCDTLCPCCKRLDEDGAHLFLKCKQTREAWSLLGMGELREDMGSYEHVGAVVQDILNLNDDKKVLACCLLWRCWLRRNKIIAGEKALAVADLCGQARYWARESQLLCGEEKRTVDKKPELKWQKPEGDQIKINTDGAFDINSRQGGWGFVARDAQGLVRVAGADYRRVRKRKLCSDVLVADRVAS
jgi:hypothetical protein